MDQLGDQSAYVGQGSEPDGSIDLLLAGTAQPVPGRTKVDGARIIMNTLQRASEGQPVLRRRGQRSEWLHKCFLSSDLDIGRATWKYFKQTHADAIELDDSQQWVRLRHPLPDEEG